MSFMADEKADDSTALDGPKVRLKCWLENGLTWPGGDAYDGLFD